MALVKKKLAGEKEMAGTLLALNSSMTIWLICLAAWAMAGRFWFVRPFLAAVWPNEPEPWTIKIFVLDEVLVLWISRARREMICFLAANGRPLKVITEPPNLTIMSFSTGSSIL